MKISGAELIEFSESVGQIIDGVFEAKSEGAAKYPWARIILFRQQLGRSLIFKTLVIDKVRERFDNVTDILNDK